MLCQLGTLHVVHTAFHVILTLNGDYLIMLHYPVGLVNGDDVCVYCEVRTGYMFVA